MMWRRSLLATASISVIDTDNEKASACLRAAEAFDDELPDLCNDIHNSCACLLYSV
jgi:hypothetical protein